ncbi:MAG: AAA family ATPase [Prochlorothrix sp.]
MVLSQRAREIQTLVQSFHPLIAIETVEEERVQALLQEATQDMNMTLFEWSAPQGLARSPGGNVPWTNDYAPPGTLQILDDKTWEPLAMLRYIQDMNLRALFWLKDLVPHLDEPVIIRQFREVVQMFAHHRSALVLTGNSVELPPEIAPTLVYFDLKLPGRDELERITRKTLGVLKMKHRIQVQLQDEEQSQLVKALTGMTLQQAQQVLGFAAFEDGLLDASDIQNILNRKAQVIREESLLQYFPSTTLTAELGGFGGLKRWLDQAQVGFSAAAKHWNLPAPKGILIVGIQGCGKSLAAKAIARLWQMPLLKLEAGRIYDKYVGESEKNFRQAVTLAESMAPSILWIDELEKGFSLQKGEGDGGLSQRLFGFFLTWLQEKSQEVFVVATANDISQIPPELLRKGRFDEIFFVDLPDAAERASILKIHLKLHGHSTQKLDLETLVQAMTGFSGAEIEQAVISALYRCLYLQKPLETAIILEQIQNTIPLSVSRREDLDALRLLAKDRFVSVR